MELLIKVKAGKAVEHPVAKENLLAVLKKTNINDLPSDWVKFERVPKPSFGPYEVYVETVYQQDGGVFKDVHVVRLMNEEEKQEKQSAVKNEWGEKYASLFPSWIFVESQCEFAPPVPYPDDGGEYHWDESGLCWVLFTGE